MCLLPCVASDNSWVKNEQNHWFGHFHHLNFLHVHVLCVWLVATLEGGSQLPRGGECPPPPTPLNETLAVDSLVHIQVLSRHVRYTCTRTICSSPGDCLGLRKRQEVVFTVLDHEFLSHLLTIHVHLLQIEIRWLLCWRQTNWLLYPLLCMLCKTIGELQ